MGRRLSAIFIATALAALWFSLSGRTEPLLLILGALSIVLVIGLLARMRIVDAETAALRRAFPLLGYWAWLAIEIVKANIAVARAVLRIDLDIAPQLIRVRAGQTSDFGRTIYANSITLTPGTVTVDIDGGDFIVHALLESMSDPAGFEEMNRRATLGAEGRAP